MNFIILIIAYLIGSTPSALIIGKVFYNGTDIRKIGSGNLGTTNMLRNLGFRAALATAAFDVLVKGTFTTLIAVNLYNNNIISVFPLFIGMISAVGHAFPIFAKFKGGKMVATSIGVLLPIDWRIFIIAGAILILILLITKIMSLGSFISVAVGYFSVAYFYNFSNVEWLITIAFYIFILYLHRENIMRIFRREEKHIDVIKMLNEKLKK
ncbi:MAG: glycerol-3-phosphate 1-O-acyltransferase PlsY [Bacilli bacterium]